MFGTFCPFASQGPADEYFRPITRETWEEPCFAPVRYAIRKFTGKQDMSKEFFEVLWDIDDELTEIADWDLNDDLGRYRVCQPFRQLLEHARENVDVIKDLQLEFEIIGDQRINTPAVIEQNKMLVMLGIRQKHLAMWPLQLLFRFDMNKAA